jgi:hypothetical protein
MKDRNDNRKNILSKYKIKIRCIYNPTKRLKPLGRIKESTLDFLRKYFMIEK